MSAFHRFCMRGGARDSGQALAVIVVLVAVLMLIPASIQMTASNQLPMSQQVTFSQQALQAARAGLSDYVNWVQGNSNYPSGYCSSGASLPWTCPRGKSADATNPAFANSALASKWVYTQGSSTSSPSVAYQYLVNSSGLSSYGTGDFTVYATGRAGDPGATGGQSHWVYQTIQATLQYGAPGSGSGGSGSSCAAVTTIIPSWATYIGVTAIGAEGGGAQGRTDPATVTSGSASVTDTSITAADQGKVVTGTGISASYVGTVTAGSGFLLSSSPTAQINISATANATSVTIGGVGDGGDGAELGATITDTFPLAGWTSPFYVTYMPGSPGYSGNYSLLSLAASGGTGGCGATGLNGGNGGGQGLGISTEFGGGGGAASALCFGTASQCTSEASPKLCNPSLQIGCLMIVAGGGGGHGGANSLGTAGGSGGYYPASYTGNGANGTAVLGLGSASGGTLGGNSQPYGGAGGGALLGALNGSGGGGGGGYLKGGSGGGAGLLGLGLGSSGGGGGAGNSSVSPTPISCNSSPTVSQASAASYDTNGDGSVSIQLYTGSSCSSLGPAEPWLSVLEVQQIDANSALQ